jgi:hypothetical protein
MQLGRYPEVGAVIVDRLSERTHRLSISQAISQLNRVDQRLLALFWHLSERWGRVSRDGIVVPLALSHRLIGELVGARRPTVSTALAELARAGRLVRRDDGTWLLTGEPMPGATGSLEVIRQRRRLIPRPSGAQVAAALPHEPGRRIGEMRASADAVREVAACNLAEMRQLRAESSALCRRSEELRRECARVVRPARQASGVPPVTAIVSPAM